MKTQHDKFSHVRSSIHSFIHSLPQHFLFSLPPLSFPKQQWEDRRVSVILPAQRWAMLNCLVLRILQQH